MFGAALTRLVVATLFATACLSTAHAKSDLKGLKFVQVAPPEYPPVARRYNIHGTVVLRLSVDTEGRVASVEAVESPADLLTEATIQAAREWTFSKPSSPTVITIDVPFTLTDRDDAAFGTVVCPLIDKPTSKNELKTARIGWAQVNIVIRRGGMSNDYHVARISDKRFRTTLQDILSRLRFADPPEDGGFGMVNVLKIRVTDQDAIEIEQLPG